MRKYREENFSVIETTTGKKICDCAEESDALMMISFDPKKRMIVKKHLLMGPVIDLEVPKQLPTSEIVCGNSKPESSTGNSVAELSQIKLPEGQGEPVVV